MDKGFFGGLFDFDGDGELDSMERAADYHAFEELMKDSEEDEDSEEDFDDEFDELEDALDLTGYTKADLDYMDEDERREVLEDAGLDPEDYE